MPACWLRWSVGTVLRGLSRRRGPLRRGRRADIPIVVVASAVLVELRVAAVNVAIDHFVGRGGTIVANGLRVGAAIVARSVSSSISRPGVAVGPIAVSIVSP